MKEYSKKNLFLIIAMGLILTLISFVGCRFTDGSSNNSVVSSDVSYSSNEGGALSAMEQEIEKAEKRSAYNKTQYLQMCEFYMKLDRYTGTEAEYKQEGEKYSSELAEAYIELNQKKSAVHSSNYVTGYKKALIEQYEREYEKKCDELQVKYANLKVKWENQQNYLKYQNLFLNEDKRLEQEINAIKAKYNK